MIKRIYIIISFIVLIGVQGFAQQRAVQSLYMFDQMLLNPAYTGVPVQFSATFINRDQWVNLPGAPKTQTLSMQSGFFGSKVGVGLIFTRDVIGIHEDYGIYATYAFHIPLQNKAKLSLGLQAGFNHLSSDFNMLNIRDNTDPNLSGVISSMNPNFGTGVYYYGEKFYAGFSVPFLLENSLVDIEGVLSEARQSRNYYIHAGYTYTPDQNFKIVPSILIRAQEGAPIGFDINSMFIYRDIVGLGASYRSGDAIVFLFELRLLENLHFGYAYDYTTSELNQFSNGSHEIMLNYRVKIGKIHKGLPCPAYF